VTAARNPEPLKLALSQPEVIAPNGGPRTEKGKRRSRMNAEKHGILSGVVPKAEHHAYGEHLQGLRDCYMPVGYVEEFLVERIGVALWRLRRLARYESLQFTLGVEFTKKSLKNEQREDPEFLSLAVAQSGTVDEAEAKKFSRYESHLERSLYRSMHELEAMQDKRKGRTAPLVRAQVHGVGE
jgi:hypothetical protein